MMKRIAIFASGNGTNAENICKYFENSNEIKVVLLCTNKKDAFVLNRIHKFNIPSIIFSKKILNEEKTIEKTLSNYSVDFIVLAGFLLKIPKYLVNKYEKKIINIHPSLLPKHGGAGMYGDSVHESVLKSKDVESGVTVHYVNHKYDEGGIIFQKSCRVEKGETIKSLSKKVSELEYSFFPKIIEKVICLL